MHGSSVLNDPVKQFTPSCAVFKSSISTISLFHTHLLVWNHGLDCSSINRFGYKISTRVRGGFSIYIEPHGRFVQPLCGLDIWGYEAQRCSLQTTGRNGWASPQHLCVAGWIWWVYDWVSLHQPVVNWNQFRLNTDQSSMKKGSPIHIIERAISGPFGRPLQHLYWWSNCNALQKTWFLSVYFAWHHINVLRLSCIWQ